MDELDLDLNFQIDNFEEELKDESISSSSGPDSEIDKGEVGDFDDESNAPQARAASTNGFIVTDAVGTCIAYRHEPEPELQEDVDLDLQMENYGDARPRGNQDHARLDPNSTENWYVVEII